MVRVLLVLAVLSTVAACGSSPAPAAAPSPAGSPAPSPAAMPVVRLYLGPAGSESLSLPPASGALCGPHYGLKLARAGQAPSFEASTFPSLSLVYPPGLADAKLPPSGDSFVAGFGQGCGRTGTVESPPKFVVRVGDKAVEVGGKLDTNNVVVVAAPASTPVSLEVTDSGRTASMNLRTGATKDAPTGFDPVRSDWEVLAGTDSAGDQIGGGIRCTVVPFDEEKGWAAPGRAWLLVSGKVEVAFNPGTEVPIDAAQALSVTGPGGKKIPVTGDLSVGGANQQQGETDAVAVDVPATGKVTVHYSFKPSGIGWSGQSGSSVTV